MTPKLPSDDPLRVELNDEVHARPSEVLIAPLRLTYLALRADPEQRQQEWDAVARLARQFGALPPAGSGASSRVLKKDLS